MTEVFQDFLSITIMIMARYTSNLLYLRGTLASYNQSLPKCGEPAWSWGNIYIDFDIISTNYTARLRANMLTHSVETIVSVCWLCIQCIPALKYMYSLEMLATWGQGSPSCVQKCTLFWAFLLHKVTPPPAQSWLSPSGRHHVFSYPWTNRKTLQLL